MKEKKPEKRTDDDLHSRSFFFLAADVGIGGFLGVFAAGEKNMVLGIVRSADHLKFQIVFIRLAAENINGRDQKPLFDGIFHRQASQGCGLAGTGP